MQENVNKEKEFIRRNAYCLLLNAYKLLLRFLLEAT